jgi:hypothetical protein
VLGSKRRGYLALAGQFERLVKLERLRHLAKVESVVPLSQDVCKQKSRRAWCEDTVLRQALRSERVRR